MSTDEGERRAMPDDRDAVPGLDAERVIRSGNGSPRVVVRSTTLMERVRFLRLAEPFAPLPDRLLGSIAADTEEVWLGAGEHVWADHDRPCLYVMTWGEAELHRPSGRSAAIHPGALVFTEALFGASTIGAKLSATTDARLLRVDADVVETTLRSWPGVTLHRPGSIPPVAAGPSQAGLDADRRDRRASIEVGSSRPDLRRRVGLLLAQGFTWGLTLAFVIIPASALFIDTFGAALLPATYLAVAAVGALLGVNLRRFQQRVPLKRLTLGNPLIVAGWSGLTWVVLATTDGRWLVFGLPVLFNLEIQAGFVTLGGQAGRLLDVREIKQFYPRVIAGKGGGFLVGGLVAAPLSRLIGGVTNLLIVTTGIALTMAIVVALTNAVFGDELGAPDAADEQATVHERAPIRSLFRDRYIGLLVVWQVLSATVRQLVDFLVYERAGARYDNAADLATFVGGFTAVLNITDLLFVGLLAGFVISRLGLRFGLIVNSAVVGILLAVSVGAAGTYGLGSTVFLLLIGAARIADISLNDGATIASLNATYQPLTVTQRLRVQLTVEAVGVPLAIGATGVFLLAVTALPGVGTAFVTTVAALLCAAWTVAGVAVYRRYRVRVVDHLGGNSAVDAHAGSSEAAELFAAAEQGDPEYGLRLLDASTHPDPGVRAEVATRLGGLRADVARRAVEVLLDDADPDVRSAAVGARSRRGEVSRQMWETWLRDPSNKVQIAALAGLLQVRGHSVDELVARRLLSLLTDANPVIRRMATEAIGRSEESLLRFLDWLLTSRTTAEQAVALEQLLIDGGIDASCGDVLADHLVHPAVRVSAALAAALGAIEYEISPDDRELVQAMIAADTSYGTLLLEATIAVGDLPGTELLLRALSDELEHLEGRLYTLLGLLHDSDAVRTARNVLSGVADGDRGLALEALEVSVAPVHRRAVVGLLRPGLKPAQRLRRLGAGGRPGTYALWRLFADPGRAVAHDWLCACIVHALTRESLVELLAKSGRRPSGRLARQVVHESLG